MIKLITTQLRLILPVAVLLYVFGFAAIFFIFPELAWTVAMFAGLGTYFGSHRLRRSEWYLSLSFSRRKILALIILETVLIGLVNVVLTAIGFLIFQSRVFAEESSVRLFFWSVALATAFGIVLSLSHALSGKPVRRPSIEDLKPGRRSFIAVALVLLGWILLPRMWAVSKPILIWAILCFVALSLSLFVIQLLVLPELSFKKVRRWATVSCLAALAGPIFGSWYLLHLGSVDNQWMPTAFHFLERLSGKISAERAWELFESPNTPASPAFELVLKDARTAIDFESWKNRTLKCKSADCLELSSDFSQPANIDSKDLERWFLVFGDVCGLGLKSEDRVRCTGPFLTKSSLSIWSKQLVEFGVLDHWLKTDDPIKQLFAIPYAASKLTKEREVRLRELMSSTDPKVQLTARTYMAWGEVLRSSKLDCMLEKNERKDVCRWFNPLLGNFR